MEERGKMRIKGLCAEDIVNSLVSNGYDVVTTQYAKENYGKHLDDRVTTIEFSKAASKDDRNLTAELPF